VNQREKLQSEMLPLPSVFKTQSFWHNRKHSECLKFIDQKLQATLLQQTFLWSAVHFIQLH